VSENDENILAGLDESGGVDERLRYIRVIHVQISAEYAPQHSFEGRNAGALNGPSNKPKRKVSSKTLNEFPQKTHSRSNCTSAGEN
jgi:hypothetical protein